MIWVGVAEGDGYGEGVGVVVGCGVKEAVGEVGMITVLGEVEVHKKSWVDPPCQVRLKA